jgi:hypothetical protein
MALLRQMLASRLTGGFVNVSENRPATRTLGAME